MVIELSCSGGLGRETGRGACQPELLISAMAEACFPASGIRCALPLSWNPATSPSPFKSNLRPDWDMWIQRFSLPGRSPLEPQECPLGWNNPVLNFCVQTLYFFVRIMTLYLQVCSLAIRKSREIAAGVVACNSIVQQHKSVEQARFQFGWNVVCNTENDQPQLSTLNIVCWWILLFSTIF